ncbi:MAG TPA: NTP transferase domain-containing protein [Rubricoccaceae bacterium]|jgi:molybdopterin-guanine dinucleotide biosynthesis protein A
MLRMPVRAEASVLPPLVGLVLVGGQSRRMGAPKWALDYHGEPQALRMARLLAAVCERVAVSAAAPVPGLPDLPVVLDSVPVRGPSAGILSALAAYPDAALLVVACDLPLLNAETLAILVQERDASCLATAFRSPRDGSPEPLCAVWEPRAQAGLLAAALAGQSCPRRFLLDADRDGASSEGVALVEAPDPRALTNANTPADRAAVLATLAL